MKWWVWQYSFHDYYEVMAGVEGMSKIVLIGNHCSRVAMTAIAIGSFFIIITFFLVHLQYLIHSLPPVTLSQFTTGDHFNNWIVTLCVGFFELHLSPAREASLPSSSSDPVLKPHLSPCFLGCNCHWLGWLKTDAETRYLSEVISVKGRERKYDWGKEPNCDSSLTQSQSTLGPVCVGGEDLEWVLCIRVSITGIRWPGPCTTDSLC